MRSTESKAGVLFVLLSLCLCGVVGIGVKTNILKTAGVISALSSLVRKLYIWEICFIIPFSKEDTAILLVQIQN